MLTTGGANPFFGDRLLGSTRLVASLTAAATRLPNDRLAREGLRLSRPHELGSQSWRHAEDECGRQRDQRSRRSAQAQHAAHEASMIKTLAFSGLPERRQAESRLALLQQSGFPIRKSRLRVHRKQNAEKPGALNYPASPAAARRPVPACTSRSWESSRTYRVFRSRSRSNLATSSP